jgi:two-component system, sensor histidine kinase and response regulator
VVRINTKETRKTMESKMPNTAEVDPEMAVSHLRHELRTPLNQIIGYSELMIEDAVERGRDDMVPDLEKIRTAGKNLLALVNQIGAEATPALHGMVAGQLDGRAIVRGFHTPVQEPDESLSDTPGVILVVDDNETNRDMLSRRLERQGHRVVSVAGGTEALERVAGEPFDVVLLDVMMPVMDGYEVLTRLKEDPQARHIPVIMISALDELDSVVRCIEIGAEDYLPKPFNPVLLRARLGASLEKKRLRDREIELFRELEENYQRLKELEKLRDDLTHMVVHDLRTPLTSLLTGLKTLGLSGELNEIQGECLSMSVAGGETLLGMINDLLDISKMEDGSLTLDRRDLTPGEMVSQALEQVASLAADKGLSLVNGTEAGVPALNADEDKLRRTLVNLIGNAIKFTPAGGSVTVGVRENIEGDSLVFTVQDTGEGIPKEAFGRIFEKFGQVESRRSGRKMSTGLGLTFCKLAVDAHGGRIWVDSVLGQGSTFSFTLPLQPDP